MRSWIIGCLDAPAKNLTEATTLDMQLLKYCSLLNVFNSILPIFSVSAFCLFETNSIVLLIDVLNSLEPNNHSLLTPLIRLPAGEGTHSDADPHRLPERCEMKCYDPRPPSPRPPIGQRVLSSESSKLFSPLSS